MLFVNRIGHILHSIVVQCSGAANKNIGDAFLLTWKVEKRYTAKERTALADQALLTFCKALIELGRYQEFIINFSAASTARLYKRFPGYNVRIGSGLHKGWAIEGAIGSQDRC
jgi:class 3 adenylate cyclase